ncbi:MAG: glutathione S-transferase, partial [Rhodospirillaceae bacterium]|nr:glutathione S-transferase [Rhodospirillaceae bacterium]
DFLFGDVTIADAMFAPLISRFYTYGVEMDSDSKSYAEAVWALPDLQEWIVEAKKEPWIVPAFEL